MRHGEVKTSRSKQVVEDWKKCHRVLMSHIFQMPRPFVLASLRAEVEIGLHSWHLSAHSYDFIGVCAHSITFIWFHIRHIHTYVIIRYYMNVSCTNMVHIDSGLRTKMQSKALGHWVHQPTRYGNRWDAWWLLLGGGTSPNYWETPQHPTIPSWHKNLIKPYETSNHLHQQHKSQWILDWLPH